MIDNILYLDIETVSRYKTYHDLPEKERQLWDIKAGNLQKVYENDSIELYQRAGIYAEFGKIVCISAGYLYYDEAGKEKVRLKSFYGDDEKQILTDFAEVLHAKADMRLCGHNAKEFDIPYICRRMVVHGISLPNCLSIQGKKPWEINHIDTMEMWKFGDRKSFTSLNVLTHLFGIPTPKDDIDGSMVGEVYWQEGDVERIKTYCQKDVIALIQVYRKLCQLPLLEDDAFDDIN